MYWMGFDGNHKDEQVSDKRHLSASHAMERYKNNGKSSEYRAKTLSAPLSSAVVRLVDNGSADVSCTTFSPSGCC